MTPVAEPGILPEWNVNIHKNTQIRRIANPGILPEWNVNMYVLFRRFLRILPESYQNGM